MEAMSAEIFISSPLVVLGFGAILLLLTDVFIPTGWSRSILSGLFVLLSLSLLISNASLYTPGKCIFSEALFADPFAFFSTLFILLGLFLLILLGFTRSKEAKTEQSAEFYSLLFFSAMGGIVLASASELLSLFLGLELMSLSLYCLCAAKRYNRNSTEAALKYFILGSFSSAFLLLGIAVVFGLTGSTFINEIAADVSQIDTPLLYFGVSLFLVGMIFKVGGVPFHFWVPDVYEGAPTLLSAYMASVVKGASVFAAIRILCGAFGDLQFYWSNLIWITALLSIIGGNLLAIRQNNVKRMLAYSSIAHVGYLLVAFLGLKHGNETGAAASILFYLVAYAIASIGSFGVLHVLESMSEEQEYNGDISAFGGLAKREPILAFLMLVFLLSLAGLPPGMQGLLAKFYVFYSAVQSGNIGITIVAVLGSAVSLYYYLRIVVQMYLLPCNAQIPSVANKKHSSIVLIVCAAAIILFGLFPSGLHEFVSLLSESL
ncbi:MAG: NADH-quinone oxidoreductase subunit N [SAR324 cluster bacterium]|uniref:NADH-quinone oxidoreductase subunit N n=1 Tax=SAR324 cluster bacterium TaxID=2024889 RepID=A0A7X9FSP0_9DELT|nr:NADH-quinone oxidoreductase subunit N [SAR324 cluster bacterium]